MHPWVIKFKKSKEMIITKVRSVIISGRRERERGLGVGRNTQEDFKVLAMWQCSTP